MQTIRQVFGFFLLLLSTAWWLSDPTPLANLTHVFAWRAVLLQYTGVLGIGVITGGAEGRSKFKEVMKNIVIGCALVFGASSLGNMLMEWFS